ncbi:hypothetical protein H4R19_002853 [Coemansia spiralis]|nr:hypothetical protein H4R19_002853 [Coemansia spiralis]
MQMANLPTDIQRLILDAAAGGAPATPTLWKARLRLLAVCRVWRELAAPLVYKYAYIHSHLPGDDGHSVLIYNAARLPTLTCAVATNMDLVQAVRCGRHVRVMEIELMHPAELYGYLTTTLELLARTGAEWARVSTLMLRLFPGAASSTTPSAQALACGRAMARLLPGVRALTVAGCSGDGQVTRVLGSVATHYAAQLAKLHGNVPVALAVPELSPELTHLRLNLDGLPQRLPRINGRALRSLSLYGISSGFSWACFGDAQAPATVNFASLGTIDIAYGTCFYGDDDDGDDGDNDHGNRSTGDALRCGASHTGLEILLPQLRKLRIVGCPPNCTLLEAGVFPEYLAQARIYGSSSALALISRSRLRHVGRLDVNIQTLDMASGSGDFYAQSNRVFGQRGPASSSFLYIGRQVPVNPAMVEWARLERLLVMSPLSAAALLALIARLPGVVSLVSFRTLLVDVPGACAADAARLAKAGSRIERLGVIYDSVGAAEDAELLLGHLLLGNMRLRSLTLPVAHMDVAQSLVEQHRQAAPHIATVSLRPHL